MPNIISSATMAKKAPISLVWTVKGALATSRGSQSFISILRRPSELAWYRTLLPRNPEFFFQLLHKSPVSMLVHELLRIGLYHTYVSQAQRVKTDCIFRVVITPFIVRYVLKFRKSMGIFGF